MHLKPSLMPVQVPWRISSVPHMRTETTPTGEPIAVTFIGFFKCDEHARPQAASEMPQIIHAPPEFVPTDLSVRAPFRLIRVYFHTGRLLRNTPGFSDIETIRESDYDWTHVQSSSRPGESIESEVARGANLWLSSGVCPDPSMYEVSPSALLEEHGLGPGEWHHYLLAGDERIFEVIAKGWDWQSGQPVD